MTPPIAGQDANPDGGGWLRAGAARPPDPHLAARSDGAGVGARGRRRQAIEEEEAEVAPPPLPPLTPIERRAFDYTTLAEAMAHLDAVVRNSRVALRAVVQGGHKAEAAEPEPTGLR